MDWRDYVVNVVELIQKVLCLYFVLKHLYDGLY